MQFPGLDKTVEPHSEHFPQTPGDLFDDTDFVDRVAVGVVGERQAHVLEDNCERLVDGISHQKVGIKTYLN